MNKEAKLKRAITLPVLTLYGLGTIIGAGIYVLIGEVAAVSGLSSVYAFLLSGIIAAFSAFSYAELSSRFPKSAGEAVYVNQAFHKPWLAQVIGWLVIFIGLVSCGILVKGFYGYLQVFYSFPFVYSAVLLVLFLTLLAAWGIKQSAFLITLITLMEMGGLVFVIVMAKGNQGVDWVDILTVSPDMKTISQIALGGFLAFFAFIGFEDMVNVAEEVKTPSTTMPKAIAFAVVLSTVLYMGVALVALKHIPLENLSRSAAPLGEVMVQSGYSPILISIIALISVVNGALVQVIMATRVLYGLSKKKLAPPIFSHVHTRTHTPLKGTFIVGGIILIFSLALPLVTLAKIASFVILIVFAIVNFSLVVVKCRQPQNKKGITFPILIPIIATILCVTLLVWQIV